MLTTQFSLALIWLYLKKIESLEGPVHDIQIGYWSKSTNRFISPPDVLTLDVFGSYDGFDLRQPPNIYQLDCSVKEVYQLRSFAITPGDRRGFVYLDGNKFTTKYSINPISMLNLNGDNNTLGYLKDFEQLWKEWQSFEEYIDCETTLFHFNSTIKRLEWMYKNI
jgi:hypothetical protein